MLRKLAPSTLALGLVAAACGPPRVVIQPGQDGGEPRFFVQVLDAEADVGHGLSLAVDASGNPHAAYLGFEELPAEGEPPPVPEPDAPVFPAVLHIHIEGDLVTRSEVVDSAPPEEGEDTEAAARALRPEDETAIAVDADGIHHVAWTESGTLFYANNAEGDFGEPVEIATGGISGISIAAGEDGTPWVAYYEPSSVHAASIADGEAAVEDIASAQVSDPAGTGIGVAGEQVLVAYGDGSSTMLARRDGGEWATETADEDGGVGPALAVDADGNPHIAYFNADGAVKHAHSLDGGTWEISDVGEVGGAPASPATIALDAEGIHHVAWESTEGLAYASNAEGALAEEEVPGAEGGERPRLGAGTDETLFLGWFDPEGTEVELAVKAEEEPLLALPESPTAAPATGPDTGGEPACQPEGTALQIVAPQGAVVDGFAEDCYAAPAGEPFTIDFDNQDPGQLHNVAIYESQGGAAIFQGETITGPDQTTYQADAIDQEGNLFFQCDVHPNSMTGTFVVAGEGGGGDGGQGSE